MFLKIPSLLSIVNRILFVVLLIYVTMKANLTIEAAFGQVIRELREKHKISQEKLADLSSLDRSFISLLECGHKQPSLITIFQFARAFEMSATKIITLVEKKIQPKKSKV